MEISEAPGPDDRLPRELDISRRAGGGHLLPDALYGEIRLPGWAVTLLETPPFQRLRGVSLSDVPGALLFRRPFPSRLDHALGVFHLARLARPRDRVLQVAALAHDLGHGPFSHLSEPLMRERTGENHEQRSARLLRALPALLTPAQARKLAWLRWDEAAALVLARGADGRGELLNGRLD
ncbi:MAG TPA: HD domain-containing protein, partial [Ktedonobacterales bacterium]